jgi:hypothetical protein
MENGITFHSGYTTTSFNARNHSFSRTLTDKYDFITNNDNWDAGYLDGYMNFRPMIIYNN